LRKLFLDEFLETLSLHRQIDNSASTRIDLDKINFVFFFGARFALQKAA